MNDKLNNDPNSSAKSSSDDSDSRQKASEQKTRIKGSHRAAKPPKLKWI